MQAENRVWGDKWWRFDHYQVTDGRLGPAPGARLRPYDPWALRTPYLELARLGQQVWQWYSRDVLPGWRRHLEEKRAQIDQLAPKEIVALLGELNDGLAGWSARPPEELCQALTTWCERFGLLGLFQQETLLLTLPARPHGVLVGLMPGVPDQLLEDLGLHVRAGSSWRELSLLRRSPLQAGTGASTLPRRTMAELISTSPWPLDESHLPPGKVLRRTPGAARHGLPETWDLKDLKEVRARYLPGFKGPGFPRPGSEPFWRAYSEGVVEFSGRAVALAEALKGLGSEDPRSRAAGLRTLNNLLSGVTLEAREEEGGFALRLLSSSLLGTLAARAYFDLAGGVRFGSCDRCQNLFATRRTDRRFCSTRCQDAEKKARKRHPPG